MDQAFHDEMVAGYAFDESTLVLGRPTKDGDIETGATVQLRTVFGTLLGKK
jgi:hypothetical protein